MIGKCCNLQSSGDRVAGCSSWHLRFCGLFKCRQFEPEVILLAVGWYLRFSLSYRDVEELLAERGVHADHVTVWRWVQRYAPELQRCLRRHLKPTNDSWRMDETYVRLKGNWRYLYRAVDSTGATLDFLLSAKQDAAAAKRFLAKALGRANHPAPRVINTDGHAAYPSAVAQLKGEGDTDRGLSASAGAIFEQRARAGPPRHQAAGQRQSAFPIILCRSAHARRLRSDPYDPQRPGFWKCVGTGHRFAPSLYSRSVRCDELNFRSSTPTFGSTAKLQHFPQSW